MSDLSNDFFEKYIFKGVLALAGLSLSINSYMVRDKVSEINDNIKKLTSQIQEMQVTQAVIKNQVESNNSRIVVHNDRLQVLEKETDRLQAFFEAAKHIR
jgi:cell division protein FtsL